MHQTVYACFFAPHRRTDFLPCPAPWAKCSAPRITVEWWLCQMSSELSCSNIQESYNFSIHLLVSKYIYQDAFTWCDFYDIKCENIKTHLSDRQKSVFRKFPWRRGLQLLHRQDLQSGRQQESGNALKKKIILIIPSSHSRAKNIDAWHFISKNVVMGGKFLLAPKPSSNCIYQSFAWSPTCKLK